MTSTVTASVLGSEFNNFLFASIGEDKNGTPLSVLSALTRLGIDPWEEAAKLAHLPEETAIQRMASFIARLPDKVPVHPATIVPGLIARLPRQPRSETSRGSGTGFQVAVCVIFFVLGTQLFAASHLSPARFDRHQAPVPDTILPQASPRISP